MARGTATATPTYSLGFVAKRVKLTFGEEMPVSKMTNPMDALNFFQQAFIDEDIEIQSLSNHPGVVVHADTPMDVLRYTYAEIENDVVNSVALLVLTEPIDKTPCFQLGYAVKEDCRGGGKAKRISEIAIDEATKGLARNGIKSLYIEAIVGKDNKVSQRIAEQILGAKVKDVTDEATGEPASQYLRLFES